MIKKVVVGLVDLYSILEIMNDSKYYNLSVFSNKILEFCVN